MLSLVVEGRTDREIAYVLSISSGTASRHVANILHKLEVPTRSAAAAWAMRNGLLNHWATYCKRGCRGSVRADRDGRSCSSLG